MTTNIRNLTPHDIVIFREDGAVTTFYKDPLIPAARVRSYVAAALPPLTMEEAVHQDFHWEKALANRRERKYVS